MVSIQYGRIIVGTLLMVGNNKIKPENIRDIIESKDRKKLEFVFLQGV